MDKPLHATRLPSQVVMEFCREHSYACCLTPTGALVMTPQHNAEVTDLERVRNLQQGRPLQGDGRGASAPHLNLAVCVEAQPSQLSSTYCPLPKTQLALCTASPVVAMHSPCCRCLQHCTALTCQSALWQSLINLRLLLA